MNILRKQWEKWVIVGLVAVLGQMAGSNQARAGVEFNHVTTNLSQARYGIGAAVVNHDAIFAGGYSGVNYGDTF